MGCGWTVVEARQCLNELRSEPGGALEGPTL